MKTVLAMLCSFGLLGSALADSAYVSPNTQQGADRFNQKILENQYYNECISTCNRSENIDCTYNCKSLAEDKAKRIESR